jgi:hypothetical protein
MGVTWGIEKVDAAYLNSFPRYLPDWSSLCAAGVCERFVIPVDEVLHTFVREADGSVSVTQTSAPDIAAALRAIRCDESTYSALGVVDGFDLFFPDTKSERAFDVRGIRYKRGHDLRMLTSLKGGGVAAQLRAAALFCQEHAMMVAIDF